MAATSVLAVSGRRLTGPTLLPHPTGSRGAVTCRQSPMPVESASAERDLAEHCPQCGEPLPPGLGFVVWCESCDWNVDPLAGSEKSTRRRDRLSRAVAARLSERLFHEVVADADLRPRWDAVRVAAYALAALIHLLTVAIAAAGIFLIAGTGFRPLPLGLGVILLLVAWVLRPRLGRVP